jgi:glutathione S-transferase
MPSIRLWFSPGACSVAARMLLNEIGAPFEAIKVVIAEGANLKDDFTRINPKKRVPVLALDEEVITELPAIATAISHLASERHLMGKSALDSARVYEWMNWLSGTLHGQGFGSLWRPQRFSDDPTAYDGIMAKGRKTIVECFDAIEPRLSGSFAVADAFSAVDAFLIVFYRWGNRIGVDMRADYPRYTRFAENLARRDSIAAAFAAENILLDGSR